jgi:hypothetical protein
MVVYLLQKSIGKEALSWVEWAFGLWALFQ